MISKFIVKSRKYIPFLSVLFSLLTFMAGWNDYKMYGFDFFNISLMAITPILSFLMTLLVLRDLDSRKENE